MLCFYTTIEYITSVALVTGVNLLGKHNNGIRISLHCVVMNVVNNHLSEQIFKAHGHRASDISKDLQCSTQKNVLS